MLESGFREIKISPALPSKEIKAEGGRKERREGQRRKEEEKKKKGSRKEEEQEEGESKYFDRVCLVHSTYLCTLILSVKMYGKNIFFITDLFPPILFLPLERIFVSVGERFTSGS